MGLRDLFSRRRTKRPDPRVIGAPAQDAEVTLASVDRMEAEGKLVEAVDALAVVNARSADPAVEERLVDLRHRAATSVDPGPGRSPWPPTYRDPFPELSGQVPEVPAAHLDTEMLGGAVSHHGALIVRGVFSEEAIALGVEAIERTHARQQAIASDSPVDGVRANVSETSDGSGEQDPHSWYRPFPVDKRNNGLRQMVAKQGGTWLADSPASAGQLLAELEATGVTGAISEHLGERPFFSVQKSTLRRSLPSYNLVAWHQDGSFLDADVRTMNVWVALSPCGGDHPSPGLEVLPRRIEDVLPVDGVMSTHSISYDLVDELAAEMPTVIPEFAAGDAIVFDERFLHRTHLTESMTEIRYALECWFFAPSHQATSYTPLLV